MAQGVNVNAQPGLFGAEVGEEIDLDKLNLGEGWKVGPMTFMDVFYITKNAIITYFSQQVIEINSFLSELRQGKTSALVVTVLTATLASWLTYLFLYRFVFSAPKRKPKTTEEGEKEEEPIVQRDFTIDQLRAYNGTENFPIYVGLCGEVFDVSDAKGYYGPGASYHCFAGRNATRAMAKYCFDEAELNNPNTSDLGPFERHMLNDWYQKYKYYKCYPVVGKYSYPPTNLQFTKEELAAFTGILAPHAKLPEDRVDAPIYIAVNGKIYDVSYGGKEMYGVEGPYHKFAGKDVTRALAKMSLDDHEIESSDISDLTEGQKKTLQEWEDKFLNKKKYPIVGTLIPSKETAAGSAEGPESTHSSNVTHEEPNK